MKLLDRLREGLAKADQGLFTDAAEIAQELVDRHPGSSHGYYLRGHLSLAAEERAEAEGDFKKAILVNPMDLQARFWYGVTLFEGDARKRSRVQMTTLATELSRFDENLILTDGETTVGQLLKMVRSFLKKME